MLTELIGLGIFTLKAIIIVALILLLVAGILAIFAKGKEHLQGKISIKHLNQTWHETKQVLLKEISSKTDFKQYLKDEKKSLKQKKSDTPKKKLFVVQFSGDIKASAVNALREEVTAILSIATPSDEVVVKLESAGGMVHAYGLAAAQLARFREKNIPLTVSVDKVAASGGYMMASVANKIIAAPFAIIGSIGVIVQMPNFNRLLKENNIDFEQLTAGQFKRTLTMFGHNTEEGRDKLQHEIEEIHTLFKHAIQQYRQHLDINKVATGEHWLGSQALQLNLVDALDVSDDYLFSQSQQADVYEIRYHTKKTLSEKLFASAQGVISKLGFNGMHL